MKFLKKIACFFVGHKPVQGLYEDEEFLYVKYCARCGKPHGKFIYKPLREITPPVPTNSTYTENLKIWYKYFDSRLEKARITLVID